MPPKTGRDGKDDIEKYRQRLNETVARLRSPESMRGYANLAINIIQKRTRLGYGSENNQRFTLPGFSKSYLEYRKSLVSQKQRTRALKSTSRNVARNQRILKRFRTQRDRPGEFFQVNKPNNTLTGELLESIQTIGVGEGTALIAPTGNRKRGNLSNETLAGYLREKGRGFMELTKEEEKQIQVQFQADLKRAVADLLTKK